MAAIPAALGFEPDQDEARGWASLERLGHRARRATPSGRVPRGDRADELPVQRPRRGAGLRLPRGRRRARRTGPSRRTSATRSFLPADDDARRAAPARVGRRRRPASVDARPRRRRAVRAADRDRRRGVGGRRRARGRGGGVEVAVSRSARPTAHDSYGTWERLREVESSGACSSGPTSTSRGGRSTRARRRSPSCPACSRGCSAGWRSRPSGRAGGRAGGGRASSAARRPGRLWRRAEAHLRGDPPRGPRRSRASPRRAPAPRSRGLGGAAGPGPDVRGAGPVVISIVSPTCTDRLGFVRCPSTCTRPPFTASFASERVLVSRATHEPGVEALCVHSAIVPSVDVLHQGDAERRPRSNAVAIAALTAVSAQRRPRCSMHDEVGAPAAAFGERQLRASRLPQEAPRGTPPGGGSGATRARGRGGPTHRGVLGTTRLS